MLLEHDWKLIENKLTTLNRLTSGLELLNNGFSCIRYRHRQEPGHPHFSFRYQGRELKYYDEGIGCTSPHLLDSVHWCAPYTNVPDYINKENE